MDPPFLGELRLLACNYAPKGWVLCNGQLLAINENQALFSLLGTNYGGDGMTTFAVPDLRNRVVLGAVDGTVGGVGGVEAVTLTTAQLPAHSHTLSAATMATTTSVTGALGTAAFSTYAHDGPTAQLAQASVGSAGGSQPHTNLQPYLVLNFCIAVSGLFPGQG